MPVVALRKQRGKAYRQTHSQATAQLLSQLLTLLLSLMLTLLLALLLSLMLTLLLSQLRTLLRMGMSCRTIGLCVLRSYGRGMRFPPLWEVRQAMRAFGM